MPSASSSRSTTPSRTCSERNQDQDVSQTHGPYSAIFQGPSSSSVAQISFLIKELSEKEHSRSRSTRTPKSSGERDKTRRSERTSRASDIVAESRQEQIRTFLETFRESQRSLREAKSRADAAERKVLDARTNHARILSERMGAERDESEAKRQAAYSKEELQQFVTQIERVQSRVDEATAALDDVKGSIARARDSYRAAVTQTRVRDSLEEGRLQGREEGRREGLRRGRVDGLRQARADAAGLRREESYRGIASAMREDTNEIRRHSMETSRRYADAEENQRGRRLQRTASLAGPSPASYVHSSRREERPSHSRRHSTPVRQSFTHHTPATHYPPAVQVTSPSNSTRSHVTSTHADSMFLTTPILPPATSSRSINDSIITSFNSVASSSPNLTAHSPAYRHHSSSPRRRTTEAYPPSPTPSSPTHHSPAYRHHSPSPRRRVTEAYPPSPTPSSPSRSPRSSRHTDHNESTHSPNHNISEPLPAARARQPREGGGSKSWPPFALPSPNALQFFESEDGASENQPSRRSPQPAHCNDLLSPNLAHSSARQSQGGRLSPNAQIQNRHLLSPTPLVSDRVAARSPRPNSLSPSPSRGVEAKRPASNDASPALSWVTFHEPPYKSTVGTSSPRTGLYTPVTPRSALKGTTPKMQAHVAWTPSVRVQEISGRDRAFGRTYETSIHPDNIDRPRPVARSSQQDANTNEQRRK